MNWYLCRVVKESQSLLPTMKVGKVCCVRKTKFKLPTSEVVLVFDPVSGRSILLTRYRARKFLKLGNKLNEKLSAKVEQLFQKLDLHPQL